MKLFSIRVKEFFEPIVLRKKCDGVLLFIKYKSISLDFTVKKETETPRFMHLQYLALRSC